MGIGQSEIVAPFTGAWIEICNTGLEKKNTRSLPSRERGLKYVDCELFHYEEIVAPFTGAWIEIVNTRITTMIDIVAPNTGAWIRPSRISLLAASTCAWI